VFFFFAMNFMQSRHRDSGARNTPLLREVCLRSQYRPSLAAQEQTCARETKTVLPWGFRASTAEDPTHGGWNS